MGENKKTHGDQLLERHPIQRQTISINSRHQNWILLISGKSKAAQSSCVTAWTWEITTQTFTIFLSLKRGKKRKILTLHTELLWKLNVLPVFRMFSGREVQSGIDLADLIWEAFVLYVCTPLHKYRTLTSKRNKPSNYEILTTTLEAAYGMQSSMTSCKRDRDVREPLVTSLRLPASSAGLLWCWRRASVTSAKRLPKFSSSALLLS